MTQENNKKNAAVIEKLFLYCLLYTSPTIPIGKFSLNICVPLTLLIGVLVYIYQRYSKQGYEIAVVGDSAGTAHYAGMKVNAIVLRLSLIHI